MRKLKICKKRTGMIFTALLLIFCLSVLYGCANHTVPDLSGWKTPLLDSRGTYTCGGAPHDILLRFDASDTAHGSVTVDGVEFLTENGTVSLNEGGIILPLSVIPRPVGFASELLALEPDSLVSSSGGNGKMTAVFRTAYGEFHITLDENGALITAECGGVVFSPGVYTK